MRGFLARVLLVVGCILFAGVASAQEPEQEPELLTARVIEFTNIPAFPEVATLSILPSQQTMSEQGIKVLKTFESFRSRAYQDGGGGFSIGYGFQTWKGRRVTAYYPGRVTVEQADAELRRQLILYESIVRDISTNLPQEAFDAFVSIAYNVGRVNSTICNKISQQRPITIRDFLSTAKVRNRTDWRLQGRRTREFLMALGDYEAAMVLVESSREVQATTAALAKRPLKLF